MSSHIKDLFRKSKLGPEQGSAPTTTTRLSATEEELAVFSQIRQDLVTNLSSPQGREQALSAHEGQHLALRKMFDDGVASRNKIHRMVAEGGVGKVVVRQYEDEKRQFNYLLHAYSQGKSVKSEEAKMEPGAKIEPEAKSMLKRAGDTLRKMKGSHGGNGGA